MKRITTKQKTIVLLALALSSIYFMLPATTWAAGPTTDPTTLAAANKKAQAIIDAVTNSTTLGAGSKENMASYPPGTVAGADNTGQHHVYTNDNVVVTCDIGGDPPVACTSKLSDGTVLNPDLVMTTGGDTAQTDASGNITSQTGLGKAVAAVGDAAKDAVLGALGQPLVWLSYAIFTLCGWILAIVGVLFNWTIIRTVFQFATFFGNSQGLLTAWGILRDIGNIMLLFGFIFMGVSTILDLPHSEYTAKRALPGLIIFAILMNFSLFAAEGVIDVANGFSSVVASQAGQSCTPSATTAGQQQSAETCAQVGISGAIFAMTGGSGMFSKPDVGNATNMQQVGIYLLLALFIIITAMVLLAGVIMLVRRTVVLVFLIVTSPIGFAGMAIPPLQWLAKDWWKRLIHQAFFAPVFLVCILISLKIADGLGSAGNLAAAIGGGTGSSSTGLQGVLVFALVIGFMIASLMAAQKMGASGANFAIKTAGGLTLGAVGFAGQRTAGRLMYNRADRLRNTNFGRNNAVGRLMVGALDKGGKASYDVRGSGLGKAAASIARLDVGAPRKDGYAGKVHEEEEKRRKYADSLKNTAAEVKEQENLKESNAALATTNQRLESAIENATNLHRQAIASHEANMATQKRQDEMTLAPLRQALGQKKQALDAARAAGDPNTNDLELSYNNDARTLEHMEKQADSRLDVHREAIKQATEQHNTFVTNQNNQIALNKRDVKENEGRIKEISQAPKREFAQSMHSNSPIDVVLGVGMSANHHAAEKILADLRKTDEQKLAEAYGAAARAMQQGGGHSAPSPAPAAGSAPAGGGGAPH